MAKKETVLPNLDELNKQYEEELAKYKNELKNVMTEKLASEEERWLKELEEYDKYIKDRKYKLPAKVTFDGTEYTKQRVATMIKTFLGEKLELEWKYAQGMYDMCHWWAAPKAEISYAYLDSTLRILDQLKYKGIREWENILIINDYFKQSTAEYQLDVAKLIHLSQMHNAVMDEQQLRNPMTNNEQ
ncbi:MAG: hypothetical protein IIZ78_05600 [Clostridiales bacterium]|nr:hypothetical protein [Clostridiales bacterium]